MEQAGQGRHQARLVVPQVQRELRQLGQPLQLLSCVVCQPGGAGLGAVLEVCGQGELAPAEALALAELCARPHRGRRSLFAYSRLLFVPVRESSASVFLVDLSGQVLASVSAGPSRALVMLFRADDLALVQDFALGCEAFLSERGAAC